MHSGFYEEKDGYEIFIVAPDLGATKKAQACADKIKASTIFCHKVRNPETGALSSPVILNADLLEQALKNPEAQLIVVDDIIDGGGTFIQLGKKLVEEYKVPKDNLHLFASHGIFSKGLLELKEYYHTIGCYHTLSSNTEELIGLNVADRFN